MKSKTINSRQVWQSPDGQKKIWEVMLEAEGKEYRLKTFSPRISEPGFEGDLESYVNDRGDRFVKQLPAPATPGSHGGYHRDDDAIRAQWAIGQAINYVTTTRDLEGQTLTHVEEFAKEFYGMVDRVKSDHHAIEVITRPEKVEKLIGAATTDDGIVMAEGRTDPGTTYEAGLAF